MTVTSNISTVNVTSIDNDYHPPGYSLKWNDEFNSDTIGINWHKPWGNPNNVSIDNGKLHLKIDYQNGNLSTCGVKSGLSSSNVLRFGPYGYFAIKCKIIRKLNVHNQWWFTSQGWHDEVDYELAQMKNLSGTIIDRVDFAYCKGQTGEPNDCDAHWCPGIASKPGIKDDNYHVLGWLWASNSYIWYIDGTEVAKYTGDCKSTVPMHLNLNVCAIPPNGTPGCPVHGVNTKMEDTNGLPKYWDIDYVRFYQ